MSTTFEAKKRVGLVDSDEMYLSTSVGGAAPATIFPTPRGGAATVLDVATSTIHAGDAGFAKPDDFILPGGSWAPTLTVPLPLRLFEIVVSATILILTLPVMGLIALIIWLDSRGPVLFFQRRMTLGGRTFRFVKFRTLFADAKQRFPELYAYRYTPQQLAELRFKVEDDPRVTRQGRWLRKSSLDELPNFWNVLTGKMALVGPRPEIPEMFQYYTGEALLKFTVRPGVTGIAQTSGRGRLGFHETVALDVEYVRNRSFAYDMRILLKTVWMIIKRDGAF